MLTTETTIVQHESGRQHLREAQAPAGVLDDGEAAGSVVVDERQAVTRAAGRPRARRAEELGPYELKAIEVTADRAHPVPEIDEPPVAPIGQQSPTHTTQNVCEYQTSLGGM